MSTQVPDPTHKAYLGDCVYIAMHEGDAVLTVEDGYRAIDLIRLEPPIILNMLAWMKTAGFIKEFKT